MQVEYIDYIVANGTIAMDPEKVCAVANWLLPKLAKLL